MPYFACNRFTVTDIESKSDRNCITSLESCADGRSENRSRNRRCCHQKQAIAVATLDKQLARMEVNTIHTEPPWITLLETRWKSPFSPSRPPLTLDRPSLGSGVYHLKFCSAVDKTYRDAAFDRKSK